MVSVKDVVVRKPSGPEEVACKSWPIWTCQPSTFDWVYTQTEKCLIIEGQVTVSDAESSVSFGPGDYVEFPKHLECTWKVNKAVKKYYTFE